MRPPLPLVVVLMLFCTAPLLAAAPVENQDLAGRINELEAQTQALRSELQWLRENPVPPPGVQATPTSMSGALTTSTLQEDDVDYYTWGQLQAEIKRQAWRTGAFKVVPYGILWTTMAYESQRTTPGDYTLYVPSATWEGEDDFIVDCTSTRLGLNIGGPRIPLFRWAESGGKVEVDFQNTFSTENKTSIMLRHAYWEVKNDYFRFLVGQTWDVVSPLYPGTLMYSIGWGGGNIGYRRCQVRLEEYLAVSDLAMLTLQGSLNQNIFTDTTGGPPDIAGEPADWPMLEGRIGMTLGPRGPNYDPITFGVSAHVGDQQFDSAFLALDDAQRDTWSFNADVRIPIGQRLGFQGEYFTGENLGTFLGGVVQGLNRVTGDTIRSSGGWFELWCDFAPRLHGHIGYGVDDPVNLDVALNGRTRNEFVFANLSFNATERLLLGVEITVWETLYENNAALAPGESVRTALVGKYGF